MLCLLGKEEVALLFCFLVLTSHGVKTLMLPRGDGMPGLASCPPRHPTSVPMRVRPFLLVAVRAFIDPADLCGAEMSHLS